MLRTCVTIAIEPCYNILVDTLLPPLLVDGDHYKKSSMRIALFGKYA